MDRKELETAYSTLRDFHLKNVKTGLITRGLAEDIINLKLSSDEINSILESWHKNGCFTELRLYESALVSGNIDDIKCVDSQYLALKTIFRDEQEEVKASR